MNMIRSTIVTATVVAGLFLMPTQTHAADRSGNRDAGLGYNDYWDGYWNFYHNHYRPHYNDYGYGANQIPYAIDYRNVRTIAPISAIPVMEETMGIPPMDRPEAIVRGMAWATIRTSVTSATARVFMPATMAWVTAPADGGNPPLNGRSLAKTRDGRTPAVFFSVPLAPAF